MIENLFVRVTRNETSQNFNVWVYGDRELVRGSGLFVGEQGVSTNHHFLTTKNGHSFKFGAGNFHISLQAKTTDDPNPREIWSQSLSITDENWSEINSHKCGIYFDWGPESAEYIPYVDSKIPSSLDR